MEKELRILKIMKKDKCSWKDAKSKEAETKSLSDY